MKEITTIVIHHSASPRSTTLEEIRGWHLARGFDDIGYHYVIEASGNVLVGRSMPRTGAHARPNGSRVGICITGDNTTQGEEWSAQQLLSARQLISALQTVWPGVDIEGHRDVMAPGHTECPGVDVGQLFD